MQELHGVKWVDAPLTGVFGPVRNDANARPDDTEFHPTPSAFAAQEPEQPEEVPDGD